MSAFIVSNGTMDAVVTAIAQAEPAYWGLDLNSQEGKSLLGCRLYGVNQEAIAARYGDNNPPPDYEFMPIEASRPQMATSIACLLYQMNEGDVPERYSELFEFLNRLAKHLGGMRDEDKYLWDFARTDPRAKALYEESTL